MKNNYPDRLKPTRATYAKVKDYDKVTASGRTWLTWGISTVKRPPTYSKGNCTRSNMIPLGHLQIKVSELWDSKLLERIAVVVFNVPFPYTYYFPKNFRDPWSHAIGRLPPNSSNLSLCPFIWNSHLFYLHDFFYFWWQYLK